MANPDRPQAPGYLANLMARLFHEVSGDGLVPLGVAPELLPILIELWFGEAPPTRASLQASQESDAAHVDALVQSMADARLIEGFPTDPQAPLVLTELGTSVRDPAVAAARRANGAAAAALNEDEMAQLIALMNKVIDALQSARAAAR